MKLHQNKETNPGVGFIFLTKKKFKNKKGNKYLKFGGKKKKRETNPQRFDRGEKKNPFRV